jgi:hypothetical protein
MQAFRVALLLLLSGTLALFGWEMAHIVMRMVTP